LRSLRSFAFFFLFIPPLAEEPVREMAGFRGRKGKTQKTQRTAKNAKDSLEEAAVSRVIGGHPAWLDLARWLNFRGLAGKSPIIWWRGDKAGHPGEPL
jgi:hypothetical protein